MAYDFAGLSPADFEDLSRDLVGRELGVRFEAFAAGPDGGIDGRHAIGEGATILQAKHYVGSTYAALKSKMKRERAWIDRLSPTRYILTTSRPLSPSNKHELAAIIGPSLESEADIIGPGDLNAFLRKYPEIEKAHIKLWLTGSAILECVFRSAAHAFNNITKAEIESKVRVYAPNPSFAGARDILEKNHVVIISGPPGVGKTTLSEILCYAYIAEAWELIAIRSLDDGLASIDDTKKQIFLFDDFLGKVALDRRALSHKDSDLARLIKRIRNSRNARFVLTTRAYIFEEARRVSEHLADQHLDVSKYVLDVGVYTRHIKARILCNHLLIAGTPPHVTALVESDEIIKIVDHKNYSPRIIEWMTDAARIESLEPEAYPAHFLDALTRPGHLWDIAFRTHISNTCQHLLFALFFSSEYGVKIDTLRIAYESLHPRLCAKYSVPYDPKDFEEALRILEGGFITVTGKEVRFVNPSLRDYLTEYLDDLLLLIDFATAAAQPNWAQAVWQHGKRLNLSRDGLKSLALSFLNIAQEFVRLPIREQFYEGSATNIWNTTRIELLIEWWEATHEQSFVDLALALTRTPVGGLDPWLDGDEAVELIGKLRDGDYFDQLPYAADLADNLEDALVNMIEGEMFSDALERVSDTVEQWKHLLDNRVMWAVEDAIRSEIDQIDNIVAEIDSQSTLNDHIETLQKLAKRTAIPPQIVEMAVATVMERMAELEERTSVSGSPTFNPASSAGDTFDDVALRSLFAPLLDR